MRIQQISKVKPLPEILYELQFLRHFIPFTKEVGKLASQELRLGRLLKSAEKSRTKFYETFEDCPILQDAKFVSETLNSMSDEEFSKTFRTEKSEVNIPELVEDFIGMIMGNIHRDKYALISLRRQGWKGDIIALMSSWHSYCRLTQEHRLGLSSLFHIEQFFELISAPYLRIGREVSFVVADHHKIEKVIQDFLKDFIEGDMIADILQYYAVEDGGDKVFYTLDRNPSVGIVQKTKEFLEEFLLKTKKEIEDLGGVDLAKKICKQLKPYCVKGFDSPNPKTTPSLRISSDDDLNSHLFYRSYSNSGDAYILNALTRVLNPEISAFEKKHGRL